MKKLVRTVLCGALALGCGEKVQAQKCAVDVVTQKLIAEKPELAEAFLQYQQSIEKQVADFVANNANSAQKTTGKYSIPLVFHVVLNQPQIDSLGGVQGIYDRIASQVAVLNTDFNARNLDSGGIPAVFKPLYGNAEIAFGVAHQKTDGIATTGVEIKVAPNNYGGFSVGAPYIYSSVGGGLDPWDNKKYLNVWITSITAGSSPGQILGFGVSPKYGKDVLKNESAIGLLMHFMAVGRRSSSSQIFMTQADRGRTMVHEVGHFLTLNHIWGNTAVGAGSCSDDDGVADTPPQNDANQSVCPAFPKTNCTNSTGGEMFMNFMDYVNDACMRMFTKGQVARMQSEFSPSGGSYNLQFNEYLFNYPTGISAVDVNNTFDIAPNPTTGKINISFATANTSLKGISVVNMVGQVVKRIETNTQSQNVQIDLSGMQKGMYMIQCAFEEGTVTKKVIVE